MVDSLPSGLDDLYKRTLERIESQTKSKISPESAILWLTYAFQSLSIAELHALAVSDSPEGFDEDDIVEGNVVVSVCFGLINGVTGIVWLVREYITCCAESADLD